MARVAVESIVEKNRTLLNLEADEDLVSTAQRLFESEVKAAEAEVEEDSRFAALSAAQEQAQADLAVMRAEEKRAQLQLSQDS